MAAERVDDPPIRKPFAGRVECSDGLVDALASVEFLSAMRMSASVRRWSMRHGELLAQWKPRGRWNGDREKGELSLLGLHQENFIGAPGD